MAVAKLAQPTEWALPFLLSGFISTLMGVLLKYLGVLARSASPWSWQC